MVWVGGVQLNVHEPSGSSYDLRLASTSDGLRVEHINNRLGFAGIDLSARKCCEQSSSC